MYEGEGDFYSNYLYIYLISRWVRYVVDGETGLKWQVAEENATLTVIEYIEKDTMPMRCELASGFVNSTAVISNTENEIRSLSSNSN